MHQPELVLIILLDHGLRIVFIVHLKVAVLEGSAQGTPQGPPEVLLQLIHFVGVYVTLFFISDFVIASLAAAHTAKNSCSVLLKVQMLLLAIPRLRIRGLLVVFLRSDECPESESLLDMIIFIGSRCQHSFLNPAATSTLDGLESSRALQSSHEEI